MSSASDDAVLILRNLAVGYVPGIDILRDISLTVRKGSITSLIGPNGAGKSTLLRCIFGLLKPRLGDIEFSNKDIRAHSTDKRKLEGIAYVPQHHSTCAHLTVEENLKLGGWLLRSNKNYLTERIHFLYDQFPILAEKRNVETTKLSGGQLRTLAVAKELICPPKLLLVDEPSVGMSPKVANELYEMLQRIPSWGASILLVDQNIPDAVAISDYVYMIGDGKVQRDATGRWFADNISDVIKEMLQGSTDLSPSIPLTSDRLQ